MKTRESDINNLHALFSDRNLQQLPLSRKKNTFKLKKNNVLRSGLPSPL